jgi:hypothetical protein
VDEKNIADTGFIIQPLVYPKKPMIFYKIMGFLRYVEILIIFERIFKHYTISLKK